MESDASNTELDIDHNDYDIIIIGGGLTGLTAAYNILKKKAGLSVLIIEQHDSVGGRLKYGDVGFYAHSFQKHICRLVEELNLVINFSQHNDDKQRILYTKNGAESRNEISAIDACQVYYFIKLLHTSSMELQFNEYSKTEWDSQEIAEISVNYFLQQTVLTSKARLLCQSIIYAICGVTNLENISCLWLMVMLHNAGGFFQRFKVVMSNNTRYFIKGGMMEIINHLRDIIDEHNGIIKCSEVVNKINFNEIRAWVTTSLKTYKCGYVIIAVPPPISTRIIIEPILPGNTLTTQLLYHTEKNVYFQVKYKSPFWRAKYVGSIISTVDSGTNLKIAYDASQRNEDNVELNIIAGFLTERTTQSTKLLNIFQTLNRSFEIIDDDDDDDNNNANKYLSYNECESQSPMAVLKPCSIKNHINPMLTPLKRIYFAASEYAREFPGTIDGAIEAGERVSCFVLHHARPQVLNISELIEYIPPKVSPRYELLVEQDWACAILATANILILFTFLRRAYVS